MDGKNLKDNINPTYYKRSIQVTDFIIEYNMNFLEGNIIKYVARYKNKNGLEDLKKYRENGVNMGRKQCGIISHL